MFPPSEETIAALGGDAARLLGEVGDWMVRRKESVEVLDETLVKRRMSVNFRLPEWVEERDKSAGGEPIFYAPLFLLQKGSDELPPPGPRLVDPPPHFANFDLRNASGDSLPLPPRAWNAKVSVEALKAAARTGAQDTLALSEDEWEITDKLMAYIATSERNEAVVFLQELRANQSRRELAHHREVVLLRELLDHDHHLSWLLAACAVSSVAPIPLVGKEGREGIVKLAYDEQIATFGGPTSWERLLAQVGLGGYPLWIDTPFIGASTYHVEVAAPEGTEIYDSGLLQVPEEEGRGGAVADQVELRRVSGVASQVHLYVPDARAQRGALTWVRLRVRRQQFFSVAAIVSVLVTAVLWTGVLVEDRISASTRGVAELLFLFPAAIATYAVRPAGHRLTSRMLRVARFLLGFVALTPFVAAARLALEPRVQNGNALASDGFADWWFILAILSSVAMAVLVLARFLPVPAVRFQDFLLACGMSVERQDARQRAWRARRKRRKEKRAD